MLLLDGSRNSSNCLDIGRMLRELDENVGIEDEEYGRRCVRIGHSQSLSRKAFPNDRQIDKIHTRRN